MPKEILNRFEKKMGFAPGIMNVVTELDPKMTEFYEFCDSTIQEDGALSSRMKMLMIMAIGAERHCRECVVSAMRGAYNKGATEAEILEAIRVVAVGGGAPAVAACKEALEMLKQKKFKKGSC